MLDRANRAFRSRIRRLSKRVLFSDFTVGTNGAAESINMQAEALPAGAVILGRAIRVATLFTGAGATAVGLTVGYTGQLGAVVSALEVNNTTATARDLQGTSGTSPIGTELGGQIPKLTFTPDGGHNLDALTAGDLTVDLYWTLPDDNGGA